MPNPSQPYVGRNAFAHKGGMHIAGVRADATTFEHVDPHTVGNRRELVVSELSGRGTVLEKAEEAGLTVDGPTAERVLERLKALEHGGYQFEAADGSFELLIRKETGDYEPLFRLESWRVIVEQRADGKVDTEATVKVWLDGERYVRTAEGNGPVNALDAALRSAITEIHPHLRDIELVNYKVRILDETKGTGAITRVLIDASDGDAGLGLDRRGRERHRRLVAGARRLARAAHAAGPRRGGRRGTPRRSSGGDPARPAGPGRARRSGPSSRSCGPGTCRSGRACRSSSGASPSGSACRTRAPSRAAPPGCTSRCARSACRPATRS